MQGLEDEYYACECRTTNIEVIGVWLGTSKATIGYYNLIEK